MIQIRSTSSPHRRRHFLGSIIWEAPIFSLLISNTCGGYSFYKDAKLLRLTRYRYNNIPNDEGDVITTSRTAIPYGIRAGCRSKQSLTLMSAAMVWGTAVSLL